MVWKFSELSLKKFFLNINFIWLCWVFLMTCRIFSSGMWDLVSWSGIKPRPHALGAWESQVLDYQRSPPESSLYSVFFFFFGKSKMVLKNKFYWLKCFLVIKTKSKIPSGTFPQFNCGHLSFLRLLFSTILDSIECFFFHFFFSFLDNSHPPDLPFSTLIGSSSSMF